MVRLITNALNIKLMEVKLNKKIFWMSAQPILQKIQNYLQQIHNLFIFTI